MLESTGPQSAIDWLRSILVQRQQQNPQYSLRTFARDLGIPPGRMSEILNGRRRMTFQVAQKIVGRLQLQPHEEQKFLEIAGSQRAS